MIDMDDVVIKRRDIAEVPNDGEELRYAVMPCGQGRGAEYQPLVLVDTAALIWHELTYPRSLDELIEQMKSNFSASEPSIADDVRSFVVSLSESGLVEIIRPGGGQSVSTTATLS